MRLRRPRLWTERLGNERLESDLDVIGGLSPSDRAAIVELFRDELARGWIPRRADIEAALHAVQAVHADPEVAR